MCIACELGLWIAMDALPDGPPPGFPGARATQDDVARFACDAPEDSQLTRDAQPPAGERAP
jgi:hypothetical protein